MENKMDVLREKLYELLKNNANFQQIYTVSVELDSLITIYYKQNEYLKAKTS